MEDDYMELNELSTNELKQLWDYYFPQKQYLNADELAYLDEIEFELNFRGTKNGKEC